MVDERTEEMASRILDLLPAIFHDKRELSTFDFYRRLGPMVRKECATNDVLLAISYLSECGLLFSGEGFTISYDGDF